MYTNEITDLNFRFITRYGEISRVYMHDEDVCVRHINREGMGKGEYTNEKMIELSGDRPSCLNPIYQVLCGNEVVVW